MSPLKCRKEAPIDAVGPSQAKKQKVQKKKKGTPKKKKTPIKKKLKKATADPPTTIVSSLRRLVYEPCCSLWGTLVYDMLLCNLVVGMLEPYMVVNLVCWNLVWL